MKQLDKPCRYWTSILYPENLIDNFDLIIESWHVPAWLSPLHDKDIMENGELKKAHYHLILYFDGKKSGNQVKDILSELSFDPVKPAFLCPEPVNSVRGAVRYLVHQDNPKKHHYDVKDILTLSGASLVMYFDDNNYLNLQDIISFCASMQVSSFRDLLLYANENKPDWLPVISKNAFVVRELFRSTVYEQF